MDKKIFLLAAAGIILSGMKKATTPNNGGGGTGGGHEGAPGPGVQTPDPIGGAIKGAVGSGLSAAAAAGLAAIKGALGVGTASAGADAGLATTTAGTAHEGAAASGAAAGGGAAHEGASGFVGTAGTAHEGVAGAAASGEAAADAAGLAGLSVASIAIVAIYVVVVIAVIIIVSVFAMNMKLKTAIGELSRRSVKDLHAFEIDLFAKIRASLDVAGDFQEVDVADLRFGPGGSRATFAYRPTPLKYNVTWMGADKPAVAMLRMFKQIRSLSLEYIHYRAHLLDNMGNGFYPDLYEHGFATNDVNASFNVALRRITDFAQSSPAARAATEAILPPANWGGYENLPLLDGQTQYSIAHPESLSYGRPTGSQWQAFGPAEWFVARDATPDTAYLGSPYGARLLQSVRLKALGEVMSLFQFDPTVVLAWEGYAHFVVNRLGINDVVSFYAPSGAEPWNGWTFYTNPAFFGAQVAFDVWEIRLPSASTRDDGIIPSTSGRVKRNAGVPVGDKRLGATWLVD